MLFEWDKVKENANIEKHGVDFKTAKEAFFDSRRITAEDKGHSTKNEKRYFCFGRVGDRILTVRFTVRRESIRILGAGYWRKGKKFYEEHNKLH